MRLIPVQGRDLSCRLPPHPGLQEVTHPCIALTSMFFCLSLPLLPSLKKSTEKCPWRKKHANTATAADDDDDDTTMNIKTEALMRVSFATERSSRKGRVAAGSCAEQGAAQALGTEGCMQAVSAGFGG